MAGNDSAAGIVAAAAITPRRVGPLTSMDSTPGAGA